LGVGDPNYEWTQVFAIKRFEGLLIWLEVQICHGIITKDLYSPKKNEENVFINVFIIFKEKKYNISLAKWILVVFKTCNLQN
jgi:hypothetical protein